jgi:hypothetical protein
VKINSKQPDGTKVIRPEFSLFKYGFCMLKKFFDNFLCDRAVITRQLYQTLNYSPETSASKRLCMTSNYSSFLKEKDTKITVNKYYLGQQILLL